jgi:glycosyltransferase involved in cell wall biosynthesis
MLAFGHIRITRILTSSASHGSFSKWLLIVAGQLLSATQRSAEFYQELAVALGVSERCRWHIRFIQSHEIANLFEVADLVLLTYDANFCSASGVLNTAVNYRKLCLASSGGGPLLTFVQKYKLGVWIEPDSIDAIVKGIQNWLNNPPVPEWDRYLKDNSWMLSAESIVNCFRST